MEFKNYVFKKCLKTWYAEKTRVGIMAMKMNSTEFHFKDFYSLSTRRHN